MKEMDKSPTSSIVQNLITNSAKYGLTTGSYIAEWLTPTDEGKKATDPPQRLFAAEVGDAVTGRAEEGEVFRPLRLLHSPREGTTASPGPICGGRLKLIAFIAESTVARAAGITPCRGPAPCGRLPLEVTLVSVTGRYRTRDAV